MKISVVYFWFWLGHNLRNARSALRICSNCFDIHKTCARLASLGNACSGSCKSYPRSIKMQQPNDNRNWLRTERWLCLGLGTVMVAVPNMSLEPREGRPVSAAAAADNDRAGATDTYISSQHPSQPYAGSRPRRQPSDPMCDAVTDIDQRGDRRH